MNDLKLKRQVLSSLLWKVLENGGTQGIQFVIQIVLARLLLPEDYGIIVIVMFFISIANIFVQSGLNTAIIQKKDIDDEYLSSAFFLSLFFALIVYFVFYISAPYISLFYRMPELIKILRVLSLTLFFGAFNSIQNAIISKNLWFKKMFISSLSGVIISGSSGIILAYLNFGVWALVIQQITNQIIITIVLYSTLKWKPSLSFSIKKARVLLSYGWKLLLSGLIATIDRNIISLIVGKIYSADMLGYYNRGTQFPSFIVNNINGAIQAVMLPALSNQQDYTHRVKSMVRRSIKTSSYVIFPLLVGLAVIAEPLILVLLTDKWASSIPFLRILSISFALYPIHTANLQAINALGRSDIFLKLEIIKSLVGTSLIIMSMPFGIYAMAFTTVIRGIISAFINSFPNKRMLDYHYKEQFMDIIPALSLSILMGLLIYPMNYMEVENITKILIQVPIGIIVYVTLSAFFKIESFKYLIQTIKEYKRN